MKLDKMINLFAIKRMKLDKMVTMFVAGPGGPKLQLLLNQMNQLRPRKRKTFFCSTTTKLNLIWEFEAFYSFYSQNVLNCRNIII